MEHNVVWLHVVVRSPCLVHCSQTIYQFFSNLEHVIWGQWAVLPLNAVMEALMVPWHHKVRSDFLRLVFFSQILEYQHAIVNDLWDISCTVILLRD